MSKGSHAVHASLMLSAVVWTKTACWLLHAVANMTRVTHLSCLGGGQDA